jgi:hypothetical protein
MEMTQIMNLLSKLQYVCKNKRTCENAEALKKFVSDVQRWHIPEDFASKQSTSHGCRLRVRCS